MRKFCGVITALATPFKSGELDRTSFKKLLRHQIDGGIQGVVVNGTTGESPTLDLEEVKQLFEIARAELAGAIPVLIGTGSNSTLKTIENSILAENWGADGLLIVTPYYNKPPQRGLVAHYKAIAESCDLPILLYNVPGRTAVSLSVEATAELSRVPNIVGIKDATADMQLGEQIISECGPEFTVTSGDDFTFLELASRGGAGVISVLSNIAPKKTRELFDRIKKSDSSAHEELKKYKRLTELLFVEANPIPVKCALHLMGVFETNEMRLPLVPLAPQYQREIEIEIERLGLKI